MTIIKHLQMNQISALNNPKGVEQINQTKPNLQKKLDIS